MDYQPLEILIHIFKFCSLQEIYTHIVKVNKLWQHAADSAYLTQYIVKRECNLSFLPSIQKKQAKGVLRDLKVKKPNKLEFIGFITSGGVDENLMRFWCINLFRTEGEAYCAHEDSKDCNVGGVLLDCIADPRTYFTCPEDVMNVVNRFSAGEKLDVFLNVALNKALCYLGYKRVNPTLVTEIEKKSEIEIPTLSEVKRYPSNHLILHHDIDVEHANNSGFFAVIRKLKLARHGLYTCPVRTLMVFVSEEFVDVTSASFSVYNSATSYRKLVNILEGGDFPNVCFRFEGQGAEYCEFEPWKISTLVPIAWVKFRVLKKLEIALHNYFTGKYVYVKLIKAQDEREDRHEEMNIDCRYVVPLGNIINLGKEL